jgi:hypothetical protein
VSLFLFDSFKLVDPLPDCLASIVEDVSLAVVGLFALVTEEHSHELLDLLLQHAQVRLEAQLIWEVLLVSCLEISEDECHETSDLEGVQEFVELREVEALLQDEVHDLPEVVKQLLHEGAGRVGSLLDHVEDQVKGLEGGDLVELVVDPVDELALLFVDLSDFESIVDLAIFPELSHQVGALLVDHINVMHQLDGYKHTRHCNPHAIGLSERLLVYGERLLDVLDVEVEELDCEEEHRVVDAEVLIILIDIILSLVLVDQLNDIFNELDAETSALLESRLSLVDLCHVVSFLLDFVPSNGPSFISLEEF